MQVTSIPPSILDPLAALQADCAAAPVGCVANAADWLESVPPPPDFILDGIFEIGSRVMLVGSSKARKSFAALQLAMCIAGGGDFAGHAVPTPRRVLLVNLENPKDWQHRRFLAMCNALQVTAAALGGDRLEIMNGRGKGIGLPQIEAEAVRHRADVVICDPLYKLDGGADESDQPERKRLVGELEAMGERTGATLVYVHHDPKGTPGDRNIRDRGAGSSIINRDVDCTLALTAWGNDKDPDADNLAVLSVLSRNAPPLKDATLFFNSGAFFADPDREPFKATTRTANGRGRTGAIPFDENAAIALVASRTMTKTEFREKIKGFGGTRDGREAFISKSLNDGSLKQDRHGQREKLIGTPRAFELMLPDNTSDTSERT